MAQINLLKQNSPTKSFSQSVPGIIVKLLSVVALGVAIYYGSLFFRVKKITGDIVRIQTEIAQAKASVVNNPDRDQLLTRQGQIAGLGSVLANHSYWSQIFKPLADTTLKTAKFTSLRTARDGTLTLRASVPDYVELNKFLQIFDLPQFNANFSDVRISSVAKSKNSDDTVSLRFEVKMQYNPKILSVQAAAQ